MITARTGTTTAATRTTLDDVAEIIHLWALAPAAIGTCCLAADRRRARARVPELLASMLMVLVMADAAGPGLVPHVFAAALLLAVAMGLAALRGARRAAQRTRSRGELAMTVHGTVGLVIMAALLLGGSHAAVDGAHVHGPSAAMVTATFVAGAALYALWSVWESVRPHPVLSRLQFGAMGASTLAMALAGLL